MKILVLGGTQFFGRRLVNLLIEEGHEITVATRGNSTDDFGVAVQRVKVDRRNEASMKAAFKEASFDVVYDQVCFDPRDAKISVDTFGDRVGRYIYTSSMAVYGHKDGETTEADFSPYNYPYDLQAEVYSYDEGKRQAEAYFYEHAQFPVVSVRVTMVVSGTDDYTGRYDYYVKHIAEGKSIGVFETEHPITYVTAWDVAAFLKYVGTETDFEGPINAGNSDPLSIQELTEIMSGIIGKTPEFHVGNHADKTLSPYAIFPYSWSLSNKTAASIGFQFPSIKESIEKMTQESLERLGLSK